jgi:hypothetical protein
MKYFYTDIEDLCIDAGSDLQSNDEYDLYSNDEDDILRMKMIIDFYIRLR